MRERTDFRSVGLRRAFGVAASLLLTLSGVGLVSLVTAPAAQAAPTWQSHTTAITNSPSGNAATSLSIAKPAGVAVGDVMVAQVMVDDFAKAGTPGQITPTGWTLEVRSGSGSNPGQAIFYRVATASDLSTTSYSFPFHQAVKAAGAISRYTGLDTADPIAASNGAAGDGATLTAPAVQGSGIAGSRVVSFFGVKKASATLTMSSPGTTEQYEFANPQDLRVMAAQDNATRPNNGTTGDRIATANPGDKWVAQLVALRSTANSAPTVGSIVGAASVNEGGSGTYSVSATDPDGDPLTYAWTIQSGNASISGPTDGTSAAVAFGDGPSTVAVRLVVSDGNDHTETRNLSITVGNVAPTATFGAPSSVPEGTPIGLSLTGVADPSGADASAGFTFAFDCGSGFGTFGSTATATCPTNDNGTRTVRGQVRDKDGGVSTYTATVTITNVAPTAVIGHTGPVGEGSSFDVSLTGASDPSSADTAAGLTYAFDCGTGYGAPSSTAAATCGTTDNGPHPVKGKVIDQDGGFTEYTATVPVDSVAPTAVFTAPASVDEGSNIDLEFSGATDVSPDDRTTGFGYAFDCGDGSGYVDNGPEPTTSCASDDDGSRSVGGRVRDKDGAASEYTATVAVDNVAPSGTFSPASVDEGSPIKLSIAGVTDPGTGDVLEYAFSCDGENYGPFGTSNAASCPTDDNGDRTVGAKVRDDDGGETTYGASVEVANVDPTATMVVNPAGPIDEGSSFTVSLTDPADDSPVDAESLTFSFDCGDGTWSAPATADSLTCTPDDNTEPSEPLEVRAKVIDKDGGETPYTQDVDVLNVAPSGTFNAPATVNEGEAIGLSLTGVTDPSQADTASGFRFAFDCGDGTFSRFTGDAEVDCATSDNTPVDEPLLVRARVKDRDDDFSEYALPVSVLNIAPSATFAAGDVNEGSDISLSLTAPEDPSSADTAAGFTYAFDCGDGAGLGAFGPSTTRDCETDDSGKRTVTGAIRDKDGGTTEYTVDLTVHNVAPTGTFTAADVNEGMPISLSIDRVTDPSSVDTGAGFEYAFDCGSGYGAWSTTPNASCPTLDNGSRNVGGKVRDKEFGESESRLTVTIANVAPAGTFTAPTTVNEGDDIQLAITDPSDPSPTDTGAGFTYAFSCGDGGGLGPFGAASTRDCPTDDDGSRDVSAAIRDKDLEATQYDATVTVDNVAPSATFSAPTSVDEGQGIALALSDPTDPSSADEAAGFDYAFDCGSGYGSYGASTNASCPTTDNGSRTVGGRIRDKDGGVREYTVSVTVNNVAPTVVPPAGQSTLPGISTSFGPGSFSDPGSNDSPWRVDISWGDGLTDTFDAGTQGPLGNRAHTYALAGSYAVTVRVTDKDGGWSEASFAIEVNLTDKVLLGNEDVEISGATSRIVGNVQANREVKITGSGGDICGDITAGGAIRMMGTQSCGTRTASAPMVALPNMASYVPTAITHTLTGDRSLNGYTCALATGCVVKVTGKLEIRGAITGKVWFLVDKDVVIKGDLGPANAASRLRIYGKLAIDAPVSKAVISGQFLAETGLKLNGSGQILNGLFWGKQYVDMSGSGGSLRGAVISNGLIKLAGSNRTNTYDAAAIRF